MREGTQFYRCILCGTVVNLWEIREGDGCGKCGGLKIRPTSLGIWEKLVQLFKHPSLFTRDETL